MSRDEAADMQAAYASLFNRERPVDGSEGSPWPEAKPFINAWCPHQKRCRIGAVYATRWGYLWLHLSRTEAIEFVGDQFVVIPGRLSVGYTLLTFPDGMRRNFGHGTASVGNGVMQSRGGCRHAAPASGHVPFVADELFELLAAVRAGRIRRPADYVAPWSR